MCTVDPFPVQSRIDSHKVVVNEAEAFSLQHALYSRDSVRMEPAAHITMHMPRRCLSFKSAGARSLRDTNVAKIEALSRDTDCQLLIPEERLKESHLSKVIRLPRNCV